LNIDVLHADKANVSKTELRELVAKRFKADAKNVVLFGFRTAFGGGRSSGFGLIYDDHDSLIKFEP
jgi:small subunit ribosomal protein S24e